MTDGMCKRKGSNGKDRELYVDKTLHTAPMPYRNNLYMRLFGGRDEETETKNPQQSLTRAVQFPYRGIFCGRRSCQERTTAFGQKNQGVAKPLNVVMHFLMFHLVSVYKWSLGSSCTCVGKNKVQIVQFR